MSVFKFENNVGLEGLANRLGPFIPERFGSFIEIGGYDGVTQSNTLALEKRGWRGILIEAIYPRYLECKRNRPLAEVYHCACAAPELAGKYVKFENFGLMSFAKDMIDEDTQATAETNAREVYGEKDRDTYAICQTLSSIIAESAFRDIDLLSLDVEGAEIEVLRGLNFEVHAPKAILVETRDNIHEIVLYLRKRGYRLRTFLSRRKYTADVLFLRA